YTGVMVSQGDHLVDLYSPELLAAQEELIQSIVTVGKLQADGQSIIRERAVATIEAAREKLRLWGLTAEQVQQIETSARTKDHLTIYAPVSGIVVEKHAREGEYVQTGSRIYSIADLKQVWVKLDAYESHLAWIHYGQEVSFETEAYPGETFKGRISFIDPVLDPRTRTV
ncbi:MAG: HlyD family efflux transporter periplasmic adaptor subunit, partial [Xanthomonadales bacterium]|nr:efflux RND transporter periplasmic adaptor subunit [Xanthomonadales bacterium]NIX13343.1 HlyD family efflux transporter periplasmic adaptor subunit [Xanthomonadales bacterium]